MIGRNFATLSQTFRETGERFLIEARHRRPAELVIDEEPDRVGANVDDRVGPSVDLLGALGVELARPQRLFRSMNLSLRHPDVSPRDFIMRRRRRR
jgi:hypothetical protein